MQWKYSFCERNNKRSPQQDEVWLKEIRGCNRTYDYPHSLCKSYAKYKYLSLRSKHFLNRMWSFYGRSECRTGQGLWLAMGDRGSFREKKTVQWIKWDRGKKSGTRTGTGTQHHYLRGRDSRRKGTRTHQGSPQELTWCYQS